MEYETKYGTRHICVRTPYTFSLPWISFVFFSLCLCCLTYYFLVWRGVCARDTVKLLDCTPHIYRYNVYYTEYLQITDDGMAAAILERAHTHTSTTWMSTAHIHSPMCSRSFIRSCLLVPTLVSTKPHAAF